MRHVIAAVAALVSVSTVSSTALAGPNCGSEPRAKWLTEEATKAKAVAMGYKDIHTLKTSGNCYEVYGYTKDGMEAEVYLNPVTGEVVQSKIGRGMATTWSQR